MSGGGVPPFLRLVYWKHDGVCKMSDSCIFFHEKFTFLDDDDHHHNTGHCDDVNHLHIIDNLIKGASKESS